MMHRSVRLRVAVLSVVVCASCALAPGRGGGLGDARLSLRWDPVRSGELPVGTSAVLGADATILGHVYAPTTYAADAPIGMLVLLHGAGGHSANILEAFVPYAESSGILILAPESRFQTWDVIATGAFGHDIERISEAVEYVLRRSRVEGSRTWIAGHSDGATYALSLGIANGDRFSKIAAFAAGFLVAPQRSGRPEVLLMHGTHDPILPYSNVTDKIIPQLETWGYPTRLITHTGGHLIPAAMADSAFAWLVPPAEAGLLRARTEAVSEQGPDVHLDGGGRGVGGVGPRRVDLIPQYDLLEGPADPAVQEA